MWMVVVEKNFRKCKFELSFENLFVFECEYYMYYEWIINLVIVWIKFLFWELKFILVLVYSFEVFYNI